MGVHPCLLVKPLMEPHHFDIIGIDGDDKELGRRLLVKPVEVAVQCVQDRRTPTWVGLEYMIKMRKEEKGIEEARKTKRNMGLGTQ